MTSKKNNIDDEFESFLLRLAHYKAEHNIKVFLQENGKLEDSEFALECLAPIKTYKKPSDVNMYIINFFKKQANLGMIVDVDQNLHRIYMLDPVYYEAFSLTEGKIMDIIQVNNKSSDHKYVRECLEPLLKCKNVNEINLFMDKLVKTQRRLGMNVDIF